MTPEYKLAFILGGIGLFCIFCLWLFIKYMNIVMEEDSEKL